MPRSYSWNAYEGTLTSQISPGSDEISVDSLVPFETGRVPAYLVLEPEDSDLREYVYVTGASAGTFTGVTRGLAGSSDQAQTHEAGAKIRAVSMHQMYDDIWSQVEDNQEDIGDLETASATHLVKSGDTMTGPLVLNADPASGLDAATKQYVDAAVPKTAISGRIPATNLGLSSGEWQAIAYVQLPITGRWVVTANCSVVDGSLGPLWYKVGVGVDEPTTDWQMGATAGVGSGMIPFSVFALVDVTAGQNVTLWVARMNVDTNQAVNQAQLTAVRIGD